MRVLPILLGALALVVLAAPTGWAAEKSGKRQRILMYTRSQGYQHASVSREKAEYGPAELVLMNLGQKHGFDVTATKDGTVFTPLTF